MSNFQTIPGVVMEGVRPEVLQELGRLEVLLNTRVLITSAFRAGDPAEHGKGLAVDIVVGKIALLDLYLTAERLLFTGVGVYPDWHYNGAVVGGLHLDMRMGKPARWLGIGTGKATNQYLALNQENLKKYGVI